MMRHIILGTFLGILILSGSLPCFAQEAAQEPANIDQLDFTLTIYSTADPAAFDPQQFAQQRAMNPYNYNQLKLPGYGVVRQMFKIDLLAGENTVKFTDVASGIDPTTVAFRSLTAPETAVLEQNYEYDLVSSSKLLDKYLGKRIVIERKSPDGKSAQSIDGTLLSYDAATLVIQGKGEPVQLIQRTQDITSIRLGEVQTNLITEPTLVWKITTETAGQHDAQVTYQTDGLTWRADYNIVVNKDDSAADIGAWVTILNESGLSYPNAGIKLVAGDVQRVQPPQGQRLWRSEMGDFSEKAISGFTEKSFFEYHLYTLGRTTSLGNNSTKQIELFPSRSDVPMNKTFVYYGLPAQMRYWIAPSPNWDQNLGLETNKKVDIYLLLQNSEKNGMGMPLPAGRIRVYKRDEADAALEFIGEDIIQHTPKDEEVMIRLGSAFDIVGERKQTDFTVDHDKHIITESFEITLRNHKKEAVNILIKENLFRWANWEITKKSDEFEKQDYRTIHFPVEVPTDGEKKVTYTVKYTW